jgi:tetratricopeptide (TPR) repeat protein
MSTNKPALLDPFEVSTPDEAAELSALARSLELAEGFHLIFVCCSQIPQRERLMEEVRARLPKLNIQTIIFREPIQHLLDAIQSPLTTSVPDAVFVSGLEFSLPVAAEASAAPLIANLNASRNSFAQLLPCPVVLWMPEYVLTAIMQGAPDFFSIRSGVYFFAAKQSETAHFTQHLSAGEGWDVNSWLYAEKQYRIAFIKRLLAGYKLLPGNQRDRRTELRLVTQLGALFYTQGKYDEALMYYKQALEIAKELDNRTGVANSLHQIGRIHQERGEYETALEMYEQSLRLREESGDRMGASESCGQLGQLFTELRHYPKAFAYLLLALTTFTQLQSPKAGIVVSMLKTLRLQWGARNFDAAWREARSEGVPEYLSQEDGVAA